MSTSTAGSGSKSLKALCEEVKGILPERFREEGWYLIVASTLVACGKPEQLGPLYTYIVEEERPGRPLSHEEEKQLKARLGDLLMKEWTLVGIPAVVIALTTLAKVEKYKEENVQVPEKRKNIDIHTTIPSRGTKFLQQLYRENLAPIFASWGSYGPDFEWMERTVLYGLFLSDHEILSAVETELVSLPAIMCQGWPAPTIWHLRGFRRLGVSEGDVELVQRGIEAVATWAGRSVEGWPRVKDVPAVIED
ncbi:hypothetical protein VTN00DRAFT_328 [Thermoascus crustaceus]|uniref:uncharacterized protein n=1 Tax=Thermoascus crustaceus TaxID=5088 RepID=UPI003742BB0D